MRFLGLVDWDHACTLACSGDATVSASTRLVGQETNGMASDTARRAPDTRRTEARFIVRAVKTSQNSLDEARRQHSEAIVAKHVRALFQRMPMLCGFSVQEDLEAIDVAVSSWPGHAVADDVYQDLMQALEDLADERPDAVQLLRGRTFARAFH